MKVKALVGNIDGSGNLVGDIIELADASEENVKHLVEQGIIELIAEKKAPAKKVAPKSKPKE
ncbi:hypothetical protein [Bacillus anthracis]